MEVKAELFRGAKGLTVKAKAVFENKPSISPYDIKSVVLPLLIHLRKDLVSATISETGFSDQDANELVDGAIAFVDGFEQAELVPTSCKTLNPSRDITISTVPIGCVFAILPANAFLYLFLVIVMNALTTGNQVVIRSSTSTKDTARILADIFEGNNSISIVSGPAPDLVRAFCKSENPGLLHYFGASHRIPALAKQCASAGKALVAEGQGNTWVYVDEGSDPGEAASILFSGSTRYNGETCTSINGAVIHPKLYEAVKENAFALFLASSDEAEPTNELHKIAEKSRGHVSAFGSRIFVEKPRHFSELVSDGVFGPAIWITPGSLEDFRNLWVKNRFPLCAAYLGPAPSQEMVMLPNLARLVLNGDPSLEDPFEPWGGYGRSGISRVENWHEKYVRFVQTDAPKKI